MTAVAPGTRFRRIAVAGIFFQGGAAAALSPLAGAAVVEGAGLPSLFAVSALAAALQALAVRRLRHLEPREIAA